MLMTNSIEDHSISPKIRQLLFHLGFELVESDLL